MIYSGPIPTFSVSPNSLINGAVNGLVSNLGNKAVSVALNPQLAAQLLQSPNSLGSIVTPGLLATGSQAITQALTSSIENSQALGPFGPLVAGAAQSIVGNLTGDVIQSLLPTNQSSSTRYFPGAGQEDEDADYGGALYTPGAVGADVTFSIKPAQNTASTEALAQVSGNGAGVPGTQAVGEVNADGFIPTAAPLSDQTNLFQGVLNPSANSSLVGFSLPDGGGLVPPNWVAPNTFFSSADYSSTIVTSAADYVSPTGKQVSFLSSNGASLFSVPGQSASTRFPTVDPNSTTPVYSAGEGALAIGAAAFATGTPEFFNVAALTGDSLTNPDLPGAFAIGQAAAEQVNTDAQGEGWKFTTAPKDIAWDTAAKVDRVQIFGTNQPPVVSGSRGMRDLTLSNALIEGFSMLKSVEGKIAKLESLLNYTLTSSYVKVPVYWVTANDKRYGDGNGDGGFFVIKGIKVKEELRDLTGKTTRAMVDVTFTQVPPYQVDDGRDQASQSVAGGKSILGSVSSTQEAILEKAKKEGKLAVAEGGAGGSTTSSTRAPGGGSSAQQNSEAPFVTLAGQKVRAWIQGDVNGVPTILKAQIVKVNGEDQIQYLPRVNN